MPYRETSIWLVSSVSLGGNLPFKLSNGRFTIGRNRHCEIVISDVSISRRHAELTVSTERFHVRDLESSNGTFVNGRRVVDSNLDSRAQFLIGNVELRIVSAANAAEAVEFVAESDTFRNGNEIPVFLPDLAENLTPAQLEIVGMLAAGKSQYQIARATDRSEATIHNHIQAIYRRLDIHSVGELLRLVYFSDKLHNEPTRSNIRASNGAASDGDSEKKRFGPESIDPKSRLK